MHPAMLWQFAADHIQELITQAGDVRRAREARRGSRHRPSAHLRRSTRLYECYQGHDSWHLCT